MKLVLSDVSYTGTMQPYSNDKVIERLNTITLNCNLVKLTCLMLMLEKGG